MPNPQSLAVAAHLHVLLRRHIARNTDVEWLAANRDYAAEIHRVCIETEFIDLHEWAAKLVAAHDIAQLSPQPALRPAAVRSEPAISLERHAPPPVKRYVASLR